MRKPRPPRSGKSRPSSGRPSGPSHRAEERRGKPFRPREDRDGDRRSHRQGERSAEARNKPEFRPRNERQGDRHPSRVEAWGKESRNDGPRAKTHRKPFRPAPRDRDGPVLLYGWHSVKAALENPARKFLRILATENALHRLQEENVALPIEPKLVRAEEIDLEVGPEAVHQGLLVEAQPLPSPDIDEVPAQGVILVLDQVTDPHNVGAILRSAAAFAVTAVVTTARHSPEMTGVLAKAASGALEHVPMVTVPNLARALDALKKNNVFVIGLDSEGDADLASIDMNGPTAIVVGAEGKGLRQLTRTNCDRVARLDLPGKIRSLNVSNATALALYLATSAAKQPG
jgi:23S rRNA (guanosine2251-2'-O)-methyltransferase